MSLPVECWRRSIKNSGDADTRDPVPAHCSFICFLGFRSSSLARIIVSDPNSNWRHFAGETGPRAQNVSVAVISTEGLAGGGETQFKATLAIEFLDPAGAETVAVSIGVGDVFRLETPFRARVGDRLQPDSLMLHPRAPLELPVPHTTIGDRAQIRIVIAYRTIPRWLQA